MPYTFDSSSNMDDSYEYDYNYDYDYDYDYSDDYGDDYGDVSGLYFTSSESAFSIEENSDQFAVVAKLTAGGADLYEIVDGNDDVDGDGESAFAIDESTGQIEVNDQDDLDFEEQSEFTMVVRASDYDGNEAEKTITVSLLDVEEGGAPEIEPEQSFVIKENSKVKTVVGEVSASDPDGDDFIFALVGGNLDLDGDGKAAFVINQNNGKITVNDKDDLNWEAMNVERPEDADEPRMFELEVAATDDTGETASEIVTVEVKNLKEKAASLTGSNKADLLVGGEGNDKIKGNSGNDELHGSLGADKLTGGGGSDVFVFDTLVNGTSNTDTITDFTTKVDKIRLEDAFFAEFNADDSTSLVSGQFYASSSATKGHDADDRIIYNTKTGALYYDEDGNGSMAAVKIAILGDAGEAARLSATDFIIG